MLDPFSLSLRLGIVAARIWYEQDSGMGEGEARVKLLLAAVGPLASPQLPNSC